MVEQYAQEWRRVRLEFMALDTELFYLSCKLARKRAELKVMEAKIQSHLLCTMSHRAYMRMLRDAGLL